MLNKVVVFVSLASETSLYILVNDHSFDVEQATAETTFEKKARHNGTNSQVNDQVCCPFTKLEMRRVLEVAYGMIRKYHFG